MIPFALYDYWMFSLTRREQTVLVLVLFALLAGAGFRHLRQMNELPGEALAVISQNH